MPRPYGRSSICCSLQFTPTCVDWRSIVGVVLTTVTDSARYSTWSGALTVIVPFAVTTTPSTVSARKLASWNFTW